MEEKYLAVDVGGTFIKYAVMDRECRFYEKGKVPTPTEDLDAFVDAVAGLYGERKGQVSGIAMSAAGMVDAKTGFMYNGGAVSCITNLNLAQVLQERCGVPVTIENDARSAALAELWKGALADCRDAVAIICGTGVGGAVIHNREVLRGRHLLAGEFSYLLTDWQDMENQGKLWGSFGGVRGLVQMTARLMEVPPETLSGEQIFQMAEQGDTRALEGIRQYASLLAFFIANFQFIIEPERVVIGGGVSTQPLLIEMIRKELETIHQVYFRPLPVPEVTACRFFNDSNLIGALYAYLNHDSLCGRENADDGKRTD